MENLDEINRLLAEVEGELANLNARRNELLKQVTVLQQGEASFFRAQETLLRPRELPSVNTQSAQEAKICLFRSLFRGREDVYPKRFESLKTGKSGYQPVCRNEWVEKPELREYLPVTDEVVRSHLLGIDPQSRSGRDFTIGVYPMLRDETCWFLAADFDKATWQEDTKAFLETCQLFKIPAALERSRSGNGGHIWIFFSEPIPAAMARKMGTFLLTQTMERRPEIGLDSYDRFFPSQDTLPHKGFGNLIALPLQKKPRTQGNSLFLDENFIPYQDQWAFLSSLPRMSRQEVENVVAEAEKQGEFFGIPIPITSEYDDQPWTALPSRRHKEPAIIGPLPEQIEFVLANQIYIPKADLTPSLRNRLLHLAAFQNPEFYQAQAMRLSTFGKPRIISCCEDFPKHLGLPRGCLDELLDLCQSLKINVKLVDQRFSGIPPTNFHLPPHYQNVIATPIQDVYAMLAKDEERNRLIIADVVSAVRAKRFPVL